MKKSHKIIRNIIIILLSLFIIFSIASFLIIKLSFDSIFVRVEHPKYTADLLYDDIKDEYDRRLVNFMSADTKLQGYIYGEDNTKGLVVLCHGFGGGADIYTSEAIYFVDSGYKVFCYDNTGYYNSEGDKNKGLPQSVLDLDAALTFIESQPEFDNLPVFLYGHSWGGYAVTSIFNFDHNITASVSVGGFNDPMAMITERCESIMGPLINLEYPYVYIHQKLSLGDSLNLNAVDGLNKVDTPVLIVHGDADDVVKYNGAATIASKDKIINPNVQYKICSGENQNKHEDLFLDVESVEYLNEINASYSQIASQYEQVPENVQEEFYSQVDKSKANIINDEFMTDIINFYDSSLNDAA